MHTFNNIKIANVAIHFVGNKNNGDSLLVAKSPLAFSDEISQLLVTYFTSPFKSEAYYNFYHETDLHLNEVYNYVSEIFSNPDSLYEQSVKLAKHLFEQSVHPKIKPGEFYVVHFKGCQLNGEETDAVGLFKSENKDTFLKVYPIQDNFEVQSDTGINIHKLDKGCLVFNSQKEGGYLAVVTDNLNKATEAQYWFDHFLQVMQHNDSYLQTEYAISLCKNFVAERLPEHFEVSRADQVDLLNRSAKFFKEKESFSLDEFADEVMQEHKIIASFKEYKADFEGDRDFRFDENFEISESALKKGAKAFKSVIKLDKNFHIYIHGNRDYITKGFDEASGMSYYQLFFREEA